MKPLQISELSDVPAESSEEGLIQWPACIYNRLVLVVRWEWFS